MKHIFTCISAMLTAAALVGFSSCSKDDEDGPKPDGPENTDNGEVVDPDAPVADPDGTIELAMNLGNTKNRVGTYLYVSSAGNFTVAEDDNYNQHESKYYPSAIVSLGSVRSLGNVTTIPLNGWSQSARAVKGNGYVYYDGYTERFYRLYVDDEITSVDKVEGVYENVTLLGYDVKYQHPFKGPDIEIEPKQTAITFSGDGYGAQAVMFNNSGIVPFSITLKGEENLNNGWLSVRKCTDKTEDFLYNGVFIEVFDANETPNERTATITITTDYGKSTDITVTQSGESPYMTLSGSYEDNVNNYYNRFSKKGGTCYYIGVNTNLSTDQIDITSDVDWCEAYLVADRSMEEANANVKHIEGMADVASRATSRSAISYHLYITAQPNSGEEREGYITLTGEGVAESAKVKVYQEGVVYSLSDQTVSLSPTDNQIFVRTEIPAANLMAESDAEWLTVEEINQSNNGVTLVCDVQENPTSEERTGKIYLSSDITDKTAVITVKEAGQFLTLSSSEFFFDRNNHNATITISTSASQISPTSSEDWLTFSMNGNEMTIRVTSTTENREGYITFEGFDEKLTVTQSKYAVNDSYNEDGIEGTVCRLDNDVRLVCRDLGKEVAWSTENVEIGAYDWNDGRNNWNVVTAIPNWEELYPAFDLVDNTLNIEGVTGWYIPAAKELNGWYNNSNIICWSSTELDTYHAEFIRFGKPSSYNSKSVAYYVIAVHRF